MPGGRPRKSAAAKALEGDRSKIGRNKLAAQAEAEQAMATLGLPELPPGVVLGKIGNGLWRAWTDELHRQNRLALVDASSIAAAAAAYETAMIAHGDIRKRGVMMTIKGAKGQTRHVPNPAVVVMNDSLRLAKQFMVEHGLTEASRSRLQRVDHRQEDSLAQVIESRPVDFHGLNLESLQ